MTFPNAVRIFTLILLAIASVDMLRFYVSHVKMPWGAFIGITAATILMCGTVIHNYNEPFLWWVSPMVIVYSLAVLWGIKEHIQWRR